MVLLRDVLRPLRNLSTSSSLDLPRTSTCDVSQALETSPQNTCSSPWSPWSRSMAVWIAGGPCLSGRQPRGPGRVPRQVVDHHREGYGGGIAQDAMPHLQADPALGDKRAYKQSWAVRHLSVLWPRLPASGQAALELCCDRLGKAVPVLWGPWRERWRSGRLPGRPPGGGTGPGGLRGRTLPRRRLPRPAAQKTSPTPAARRPASTFIACPTRLQQATGRSAPQA